MRHIERSLLALVSVLACSNPNSKRESIDAKQKVTPSELRLSTSSSNPAALWKLFDRSTSQGWLPTEDTLSLEASFEEEATLTALKVFGPSSYRLKLVTASGAVIEVFDLSGLSQGWNQLAFSSPVTLDALTLQFEPLGELSQISEIEFWGDVPSANAQPGILPDELAGRAAFVTNGSKEELVLQTESLGGGCAEVEFTLTQSPDAYAEAFLSFESWGLLRPSALDLSWNGVSTQEGEWVVAGRSDISKRFTLPIDASKLVLGKNELRACVPNEADGEVVLSNPVLVGVADSGHSFLSQVLVDGETLLPRNDKQDLLLDGDLSSTRNVGRELVISLNRAVAPDALLLQVQSESAELTSVGCLQASNWKSLGSQSLHRGENLVPLSGKNKACEQLKLIFEGRVVLSEVGLVGSGALERIDWPSFVVSSSELFGSDAILQGFLRIPERPVGPIPLTLGQQGLSSLTGRFSEKLGLPADESVPWVTELHATVGQAAVSSAVTFVDATAEMLDAVANQDYDQYQTNRNTLYGNPGEKINRKVSKTEETEIFLGERVGVKVPAGALKVNRKTRSAGDEEESVSVQYLSENALPPLDPLLVNVTPNESGYEFTPHGATFSPAAEITMPYDPTLFPEGLGVNDVKTYFYNEESGKWEELQRLQVDVGDQTVDSSTTHFTIMINAVLSSPENPSVSSYTPTEISSLAAADPGAGIDMIQPPSANNSGSANVSYPLWVPPGRGGFSPSLSLSYSSDAGSSWVGQGWDLRLSSIAIDARYGVPTYAAEEEPRYTLDGESLVPAAKEPNGPECLHEEPSRRYRARVENFLYILRCGTSPTQKLIDPDSDTLSYHWEVLSRDGTRYIYGDSHVSRLVSYRPSPDASRAGIFSWHLNYVKDVDGNATTFTYFIDREPLNLAVEPWRQIYPLSIEYTENTSLPAKYRIDFLLDDARRKDIMVSARPGFQTKTNYLLRAVRVSFSGAMFRQYLFTYTKSAVFEKTLLQKIEVHGSGGTSASCYSEDPYQLMSGCSHTPPDFFYEHSFSYNTEEIGFADVEQWAVDGSADQDKSGLTESSAVSYDRGAFVGIGPLPSREPSVGIDLGWGLGARKETTGFYDINGDGLPDEVTRNGDQIEVLYNKYTPPAVPPANGQLGCTANPTSCKINDGAPSGDLVTAGSALLVYGISKLGLDLNLSGSIGASINGSVNENGIDLGYAFGGNISKSSRFMDDINGDGLLDLITRDEAFIAQRHTQDPSCPNNKICYVRYPYGAPQAATADLSDFEQEFQSREPYLRAARKWVAPYAGTIKVAATATRLHAGLDINLGQIQAGLFFYRPSTNSSAITPNSILKNICINNCIDRLNTDEAGIPHTLSTGDDVLEVQPGDFQVRPGDEIYLLIGSELGPEYQDGVPLGEVDTDLVITYEQPCRQDLNNELFCEPAPLAPEAYLQQEPTGSFVYQFDAARDFRLAGRPPKPFAAPATGDVVFTSQLSKLRSSDNVRVCIQKFRSTPQNPTPDLNAPCDPNIPFDQQLAYPSGYELVYLNDNVTNLEFEGESVPVPTHINKGDLFVFRVESDLPIDPETITWNLQLQYESVCQSLNPICHDLCNPAVEACNDAAEAQLYQTLQFGPESFEPHFPLLKPLLDEPRSVFVAPAEGDIQISGDILANDPFEFPEAIFAVRSVNEVIYKEHTFDETSFSIPTYHVEAGQSISFDILARNFPEAHVIVRFNPTINIGEEQVSLLAHTYLPPENLPGPPKVGDYATPFQGGFHGWFYGAWTAVQPFNPDELISIADLGGEVSDEIYAAAVAGVPPANATPEELATYEMLRRYLVTYLPMFPQHASHPSGVPVWYGPDGATFVSKHTMHGGRIGDESRLNTINEPLLNEDLEPTDRLSRDSFVVVNGATRVSGSRTNTISFALSANGNNFNGQYGEGTSRSLVEATDLNGDGILDIAVEDGWLQGKLASTVPLINPIAEFIGGIGKSSNYSFSVSSNASGPTLKALILKITSALRPHSVFASQKLKKGLNTDKGLSFSRSITEQELQDINGDGLPDLIRREKNAVRVKLNLGGAFGIEESYPAHAWDETKVDNFLSGRNDIDQKQGESEVLQHDTTITTNYSTGFSAGSELLGGGVNVAFNSTSTRTVVSTADLNGDGLLDLVFKKHNRPMFVQFNRGSNFTNPVQWSGASTWGNDRLPEPFEPSDLFGVVAFPGNVDTFDSLLTGPDVISGTGFYSSIKPLGLNITGSLFGIIPLPYPFLILEASAGFGIERDTYELVLSDIDGDGAPDHVLRRAAYDFSRATPGDMFVKHNKVSGKENLLQTISNPLGGRITLEYQRTPNTVNQPQNQIVLSSVTVDDGHEFANSAFASPSVTTNYAYKDGFYDRNEKEFYGFAQVTTTRADDVSVVETFDNQSYTRQGLLLSSVHKDSSGNTLNKSTTGYVAEPLFDASNPDFDPQNSGQLCLDHLPNLLKAGSCDVFFVHPTITSTETSEGSFKKSHIEQDLSYDDFGNLTASLDEQEESDPTDDLRADVSYQNNVPNWILGLPTEMTASAATNPAQKLRKRTASYDNLGHLLTLTTYMNSSTSNSPSNLATSTFTYDNVGNLSSVSYPPNEPFVAGAGDTCVAPIGQQNQIIIPEYDSETRQFVTKITDGFGLFSTATYDKRFGLVTIAKDSNLQQTERQYDEFGRLTAVLSPYDNPNTPSLVMSYFEKVGTQQAAALTIHNFSKPSNYNNADFIAQGGNATIRTITIVDGLDRPIQVRKTAQIVENGSVQFGMLAQKPSKYDNVGRVLQSYQPFFTTSIAPELATVPIPQTSGAQNETTIFEYDAKDRVTKMTYPDGAQTLSAFALVDGFGTAKMFQTKVTDENEHIRKSITDGIGRTIAVIEPDLTGPNTGAVTRYQYLVTGEVSSIADTEGNTTRMFYDLRGLWKRMENPDTGIIEQFYDKNGNLIKRIEPNQRAVGTAVEYHYDKNRLFCVDYPTKQDVVYTYGEYFQAESGNTTRGLAGRLISVKDETGTQSFEYGALGELRKTTRDINELMFANNQAPLQNQVMEMVYDNFGRMLSMKYPDGENLRYLYNPAGDLNGMRGIYNPASSGATPAPKDYISQIDYDKFGNQVATTYGNGVKTTKAFDNRRVRLTNIVTAQAGGQKLSDLSYLYDGAGNPTDMSSNMPTPQNDTDLRAGGGSWKFEYDSNDRLTKASACQATKNNESTSYEQDFAFSSIHNITSKSRSHQILTGTTCSGALKSAPAGNNFTNGYVYNPAKPHQVSSVGGVAFTYDASGNLVQQGDKLFVWDDANRMTNAVNPGNEKLNVRNFYDAGGMRTFKQSTTYGVTLFVSQYFDMRFNGNKTSSTKHFFAGDTRIASEAVTVSAGNTYTSTSTKTFFFHQDHLGSTSMLTDDTGAPREYLQYFADGDVWIDKSVKAPENGYTFSGKFFDPETGLYDFGARFYDPKTSLWLGVDPAFSENPKSGMGRPMVLSAYAYASWNSIARIDPDGKDDQSASQPTQQFDLSKYQPTRKEYRYKKIKVLGKSHRISPTENNYNKRRYHELSKETQDILQPFYKNNLQLDLSQVRIYKLRRWNYKRESGFENAFAASGYYGVFIPAKTLRRFKIENNLIFLLAHELTHLVQSNNTSPEIMALYRKEPIFDRGTYEFDNLEIDQIDPLAGGTDIQQMADYVAYRITLLLYGGSNLITPDFDGYIINKFNPDSGFGINGKLK